MPRRSASAAFARRVVRAVLLLMGTLPALSASTAAASSPPDPILEGMLRRLNRVAKLYRDGALEFSCNETMTWSDPGPRKVRSSYMYVYDDATGFHDYRTRLENGRPVLVVPGSEGPDHFLQRAYSWAFVFGAIPNHRFFLEGRETALGRAAYRIDFAPVPPIKEGINDWYGNVWVDVETYQILKVEAVHDDQQAAYAGFQAELKRAEPAPPGAPERKFVFETVTTEFTVVKNGMRFPGKVTIARSRYVFPGGGRGNPYREIPLSLVTQTYDDYRFFGVRTEEEIRRIVLSDP